MVASHEMPNVFDLLSSPCGDKLKSKEWFNDDDPISFPSPCGDKLKCVYHRDYEDKHRGFRPLTGRTLSVTAYAVPAPPKGELNIGVNGSRKSSPFGRAGAQRLRGFLRG